MTSIHKEIFSIKFTPSGEMGLIPYNGNLEYGYAEKVYLHGDPWMYYSLPSMVPFYREMAKTPLQKRLDALSSVEGVTFKTVKTFEDWLLEVE